MNKDKCPCIDKSVIIDLKLALITARDTYYNRAKKLEEKIGQVSPQEKALIEKANRFHALISELRKIETY